MNWSYVAAASLAPLLWALAATLIGGALWAVRLHRGGGASQLAMKRFVRVVALLFPLALLLTSAWESRRVLRGLAGVLVHRPADQRAMGTLRQWGRGFLKADPVMAVTWFRRAALQGDAPAQLQLAQVLATGTGTGMNQAEALFWAEASGRSGLVDAMLLAGDLSRPLDIARSDMWYGQTLKALQTGLQEREPQACYMFGLMCLSGRGVAKDSVEGLAWMKAGEARGLRGLQYLPIRLLESDLTPGQCAAADRRCQAILTPP